MKRYLLLAVFICSVARLSAQTYSPLSIGSTLPDIKLSAFLGEKANFSAYQVFGNKWIILDFWNVRCTSCIANMPNLDSLQREFKDSLMIVLVTQDAPELVEQLFSKIKMPKPDLKMITGDSVLSMLFDGGGAGLHAWIDPTHTVRGISFSNNTNRETIATAISGKVFHLPRRWDKGIDKNAPLLSEENKIVLGLSTCHSLFLKGTSEYSLRSFKRIDKGEPGVSGPMVTLVNLTPSQLYQRAFSKELYGIEHPDPGNYAYNRLLIQTRDSNRFISPLDKTKVDQWNVENMYSYELRLPPNSTMNIYKAMQEDLYRQFGYEVTLIKRPVKALVLVRTSLVDKIATASLVKGYSTLEALKYEVRNLPLEESLLKQLIVKNPKYLLPIVNGTNYTGNIDITINAAITDLESVRKQLQRYDLDLVERTELVRFLVIQDPADFEQNVSSKSKLVDK